MADLVERLRQTLPGIQSPAMRGDNLVITLASFFEPHIDSDEMDESETWKRGAVDAANEVLDAIHAHYADRIAAPEAAASEGERRGLGEPVAWRWREKGSRTWQVADVPPDRSDYWHNEIVPLYPEIIPEAPVREGE